MIADMTRPLIGISIDNVLNNIDSGRYESNVNYSLAVAKAGGLPVLLPQEMELVDHYVECLDGLLLTGGDDAHTEHFGDPAHPLSRCIEPGRQKFELALLETLMAFPQRPVLGCVWGCRSWRSRRRAVESTSSGHTGQCGRDPPKRSSASMIVTTTDSAILGGRNRETGQQPDLSCQSVVSSHHQAVMDAVGWSVAYSMDGVIEAIDDPIRPFHVGVQWHPSVEAMVSLISISLNDSSTHPLDNVRVYRNMWKVGDIMFIKVGYELIYDVRRDADAVNAQHPLQPRGRNREAGFAGHRPDRDDHALSGRIRQLVQPVGSTSGANQDQYVGHRTLGRNSGPVAPLARQHPVQELPEDTLVYLLASRYCETDLLADFAWKQFGTTPLGWPRVQAICDFVHSHIRFDYMQARATRTAQEAFNETRWCL